MLLEVWMWAQKAFRKDDLHLNEERETRLATGFQWGWPQSQKTTRRFLSSVPQSRWSRGAVLTPSPVRGSVCSNQRSRPQSGGRGASGVCLTSSATSVGKLWLFPSCWNPRPRAAPEELWLWSSVHSDPMTVAPQELSPDRPALGHAPTHKTGK